MTYLLCKRNGEKHLNQYYWLSSAMYKVQIQTSAPKTDTVWQVKSGCFHDKAVHVAMCEHRGDGKLKTRDLESSYPLVNNHIWHRRIISSWGTISTGFLLYWNEEHPRLKAARPAAAQAAGHGGLFWHSKAPEKCSVNSSLTSCPTEQRDTRLQVT